ncbi:NAD(P)-binding protein [Pleomassaria siparia CBS 279.74]|uniref:NAD(P)-binding protein n=1 Tax=Pleomassaria siparia CBS 279.74 TaxID=1314801 RepID=A0A6G1KQW7_9PLEO|nr:NAD(P)-binding protein [Pleomassaria siparia CBS 279.74]
MANVLVFGPTGDVGRAAAIAAAKHGAKVWLAMRDPSKTIKGLPESDDFPRVQADLQDPASLQTAVKKSGATAAFVYVIHASTDSMKASFEALKDAGIKYVVLLSSYSVQGDASNQDNHVDFINRVHALTETALEQSGLSFTALRPAYFNTNLFWNKAGIAKGEVEILYPDIKFDFIAPEDIGTVAGTVLSNGKATKPLYLCGPQLYTMRHVHEDVLAKTLGREIKVIEIGPERFMEVVSFLPKPVAESLVSGLAKTKDTGVAYEKERYAEAVENIRKYGETEPVTIEAWLESNKSAFSA